MPDVHLHDLRHSAASAMIQQSIDLHRVGAILGHRRLVTTQRYAHLAVDNLRDAVLKIGRRGPGSKENQG
jgi:site-specific recombinase XerD